MMRHFLLRFLGLRSCDVLALPIRMVVPTSLRRLVLGARPALGAVASALAALLPAVNLAVIAFPTHEDHDAAPRAEVDTECFDHPEPLPRELFWTRALW